MTWDDEKRKSLSVALYHVQCAREQLQLLQQQFVLTTSCLADSLKDIEIQLAEDRFYHAAKDPILDMTDKI